MTMATDIYLYTIVTSLCLQDPREHNVGPYMESFIGQISKYVADLCATTSGEDKFRRAAIDIAFSPHAFTFTISRHFEKVFFAF